MYLTEFQLYSYKSYRDSGPIALRPGFNILTGQNNAGKTALLEGLGLQFQDRPHRSLETAPTPSNQNQERSRARFRFAVSQNELKDFLKNTSDSLLIPQPKLKFQSATDFNNALRSAFEQLLNHPLLHVELLSTSGNLKQRKKSPIFGLYEEALHPLRWMSIRLTRNDELDAWESPHEPPDSEKELGVQLGKHLLSRIYSFRAERMNIGVSQFGPNRNLESNARNLPEVLNVLQSNPARFERYNQLVKRVFPQIERITVRPIGNQQVEILVWSDDPKLEREDLAVPLVESGTGISQVLAMLYVLVTAEFPRIILIDEPNSFLHPGAVRALVEIFREHPQHQYIISTHSPELISASTPSTLHIVRKKGSTVVEQVDTRETQHLRSLLLEVGSRLSDVFGADSILWVEGKTEEICFPLIVQKLLKRPLSGVSIVGVLHTGDFDSEDAQATFRIYEKLSQGKALLPPAIAFIFDRELRPPKDREDLSRRSNGKVCFLSRRTYENYLLHPKALSAVLNAQPSFQESPTSPEQVQRWLADHASDDKYFRKAKTRDFLQDVDAPKLLGDLFSEFSDTRLEYNKVEHSLALTEWLIENDPSQLQELADILKSKLPPVTHSAT